MPYEYEWYDRDMGIIRFDMHGEVSWEGFHETINEICAEMDATSKRVYVMVIDKAGMPSGNPVPHIKTAMSKFGNRENLGRVIVVSDKGLAAFVKAISAIVVKFTNMEMSLFVRTIEEAIDYIEKDRQAVQ